MEPKEKNRSQKGVLARMQVVHFGQIAFNLQFIGLLLCLSSVISILLTGIYYLLLVAIIFSTLGLIFLIYPDFSSWWSGGETLGKITNALFEAWPIVIPITIGLSLLSIICLSLDQNKKHVGKMVGSIIIMIISIVLLVINILMKQGGEAA